MPNHITMDDCMTSLSDLLGEETVPTQGISGRKRFLQRTLEDLYKIYEWPFAMIDTTFTLSSGSYTLPNTFLREGNHYIRFGSNELSEIAFDDLALTHDPLTRFYYSYDETNYILNVVGGEDQVLTVRYQRTAPDLLIDGGQTAYPNPKTIAIGALRYQKIADDPNADISQEEGMFLAAAQEDYSAFNRQRPSKRMRHVTEVAGYNIGTA